MDKGGILSMKFVIINAILIWMPVFFAILTIVLIIFVIKKFYNK
ncbi:MAG: hypothetical protein ACFWUA_04345 [Sporanaerobacter sp.]|jgi:asparagine N-glycosylation enzyme membrane subunit Stt3